MSVRIYCPQCGRILGDAEQSVDGLTINCRNCKKAMKIDLIIAPKFDYLTKEAK
jgi:DNA-directed RNA polymerase subunit M/transcription elongation factor TFIIS